jgi:hypothetical protein
MFDMTNAQIDQLMDECGKLMTKEDAADAKVADDLEKREEFAEVLPHYASSPLPSSSIPCHSVPACAGINSGGNPSSLVIPAKAGAPGIIGLRIGSLNLSIY